MARGRGRGGGRSGRSGRSRGRSSGRSSKGKGKSSGGKGSKGGRGKGRSTSSAGKGGSRSGSSGSSSGSSGSKGSRSRGTGPGGRGPGPGGRAPGKSRGKSGVGGIGSRLGFSLAPGPPAPKMSEKGPGTSDSFSIASMGLARFQATIIRNHMYVSGYMKPSGPSNFDSAANLNPAFAARHPDNKLKAEIAQSKAADPDAWAKTNMLQAEIAKSKAAHPEAWNAILAPKTTTSTQAGILNKQGALVTPDTFTSALQEATDKAWKGKKNVTLNPAHVTKEGGFDIVAASSAWFGSTPFVGIGEASAAPDSVPSVSAEISAVPTTNTKPGSGRFDTVNLLNSESIAGDEGGVAIVSAEDQQDAVARGVFNLGSALGGDNDDKARYISGPSDSYAQQQVNRLTPSLVSPHRIGPLAPGEKVGGRAIGQSYDKTGAVIPLAQVDPTGTWHAEYAKKFPGMYVPQVTNVGIPVPAEFKKQFEMYTTHLEKAKTVDAFGRERDPSKYEGLQQKVDFYAELVKSWHVGAAPIQIGMTVEHTPATFALDAEGYSTGEKLTDNVIPTSAEMQDKVFLSPQYDYDKKQFDAETAPQLGAPPLTIVPETKSIFKTDEFVDSGTTYVTSLYDLKQNEDGNFYSTTDSGGLYNPFNLPSSELGASYKVDPKTGSWGTLTYVPGKTATGYTLIPSNIVSYDPKTGERLSGPTEKMHYTDTKEQEKLIQSGLTPVATIISNPYPGGMLNPRLKAQLKLTQETGVTTYNKDGTIATMMKAPTVGSKEYWSQVGGVFTDERTGNVINPNTTFISDSDLALKQQYIDQGQQVPWYTTKREVVQMDDGVLTIIPYGMDAQRPEYQIVYPEVLQEDYVQPEAPPVVETQPYEVPYYVDIPKATEMLQSGMTIDQIMARPPLSSEYMYWTDPYDKKEYVMSHDEHQEYLVELVKQEKAIKKQRKFEEHRDIFMDVTPSMRGARIPRGSSRAGPSITRTRMGSNTAPPEADIGGLVR